MTTTTKYLINLSLLAVLLLVVFFFAPVVIYLLCAFILSLVLCPVVLTLQNIPIGKHRMPPWAAALIAVALTLLVIGCLGWIIFPMLIHELRLIGSIDYESIAANMQGWLAQAQDFISEYQLLKSDETLVSILVETLKR